MFNGHAIQVERENRRISRLLHVRQREREVAKQASQNYRRMQQQVRPKFSIAVYTRSENRFATSSAATWAHACHFLSAICSVV